MTLRPLLLLVLSLLLATASARAQEATLTFQGIERPYLLHNAARGTPRPLVVALHAWDQPTWHLRESWTMDAVAEREGFTVVYPRSLKGRWSYVDTRSVPLPNGEGAVDDLGFLRALIDRLVEDKIADPSRIYAAGVSNGALMTWTLVCGLADRLAAAAPLLSGMVERQAEQCRPSRLVPLIVVAGTEDWTQPYDGGIQPGHRLLSIPETLEIWRRRRGCLNDERTFIPRHADDDATRAVRVDWLDCADPAPMRFLRIEGGGHTLPSYAPLTDREKPGHGQRSRTVEAAEELWRFFRSSTP
jgi:polyhydroxybutyrate depolymerase